LGSRAPELIRGIELPGAPPAALRPAEGPDARRRVVDTAERDVPLRLYVESFRQKIERNAALIQTHLSGDPARSSPLVGVAVRSDAVSTMSPSCALAGAAIPTRPCAGSCA
jgi:hypothetical protein